MKKNIKKFVMYKNWAASVRFTRYVHFLENNNLLLPPQKDVAKILNIVTGTVSKASKIHFGYCYEVAKHTFTNGSDKNKSVNNEQRKKFLKLFSDSKKSYVFMSSKDMHSTIVLFHELLIELNVPCRIVNREELETKQTKIHKNEIIILLSTSTKSLTSNYILNNTLLKNKICLITGYKNKVVQKNVEHIVLDNIYGQIFNIDLRRQDKINIIKFFNRCLDQFRHSYKEGNDGSYLY